MRNVIIRTDGSCLNNGLEGAKGGCAICVFDAETKQLIYRRGFKPQIESFTENRCEAAAMYAALQFLSDNNVKAVIQSDSKTVVDGINGEARRKANRDLWEPIEDLFPVVGSKIVNVELIASEENYEADKLANKAANALFINEEGEWL